MTTSDPLVQSYTPGPLVTQLGLELHRAFPAQTFNNILDPAAGSGVFGQRLKHVFPRAKIRAMEVRREEDRNLARNYHSHVIGDFRRSCYPRGWPISFDLVATNPPFSLWEDYVSEFVRPKEGAVKTTVLALLGLTSWGSRSKVGVKLFQELPPYCQWRIPATIGFHGPATGTDTRDYCWWVWFTQTIPGAMGEAWCSSNLPRLESHQRTWRTLPGTDRYDGSDIKELPTGNTL